LLYDQFPIPVKEENVENEQDDEFDFLLAEDAVCPAPIKVESFDFFDLEVLVDGDDNGWPLPMPDVKEENIEHEADEEPNGSIDLISGPTVFEVSETFLFDFLFYNKCNAKSNVFFDFIIYRLLRPEIVCTT
jgi:hypothetical protein